jgi:hypothetical protein
VELSRETDEYKDGKIHLFKHLPDMMKMLPGAPLKSAGLRNIVEIFT